MKTKKNLNGLEIVGITAIGMMAVIVAMFASWIIDAWLQREFMPSVVPNERWVSENPDIAFSFIDREKGCSFGRIILNGNLIEISPDIVYGNELHVYGWPWIKPDSRGDADILMKGNCDFHKDWFSVEITYDRDGLFEGIDTIIFRKEYTDAS